MAWCAKVFKRWDCQTGCLFAVDLLKDGCYWCCNGGNIYQKCVKPFADIVSHIGHHVTHIGINIMKTFFTWAIIAIALIISLIEAVYGNPARIIIYAGILTFMWIADQFKKK